MHPIRAMLSAAAALVLGLTSPAFAQLTPPTLLHAPSDDGVAHTAEFQIGLAGAHTLSLWLVTGPTPTPNVSDQEVCKNGVGDESCALYAVVTTTGGITITSFAPDSGVQGNLVGPSELRIVRLAAAEPAPGDFGAQRLGTLTVNRASTGDVILSGASNYVRADLQLMGLVQDTIAVPEPSTWLLLPSGLLCLALLPRLRRKTLAAALAFSFAALGMAAPRAEAQVYFDRTAFENALGDSTIQVEDFESVALDGNGQAAVDNGAAFGGFTMTSLTVTSPVTLFDEFEQPTSLTGTFLVEDLDVVSDSVGVSPGGSVAGSLPESDDDFQLDFDPPVAGAGVNILNNSTGAFEFIAFYDEDGGTLAALTLVNGFTGYVAAPEGKKVSAIRVLEAADGDDIYFDDVVWAAELEHELDPSFVPQARLRRWTRLGKGYGSTFGSDVFGVGAGDRFADGVANLGDVNGDGVVDIAIGSPGDDEGGSERGSVRIFFLERDGTTRSTPRKIDDSEGGLPASTLEDDDRFGRSVAGIGDLDGNGVPDLLVGADGETDDGRTGRVFVLFLDDDGSVEALEEIGASEGGFTGAIDPNDEFGVGVASLGDIDGDGVVDVAVGAHLDDDGAQDAGAVWILFLNADGTVKGHQKISDTDGGFSAGLSAGDEFGINLVGIGDLDRDGVRDMAVGAWGDDTGGTNRGAVYVLFLNDDGTVESHQKLNNPGNSNNPFGSILYGGFLVGVAQDGDRAGFGLGWIPTAELGTPGVLAVGVPNFASYTPTAVLQGLGAVFLLTLNPDGTLARQGSFTRALTPAGISAPGTFDPPSGESDGMATAITNLGDLDGDAFPELLVGVGGGDGGAGTDSGEGFVTFLGGFDPTSYADALNNGASGCSCVLGFCRDSRILGPPDGSVVRPTPGIPITVQFTDNAARGNGSVEADLIIHRVPTLGADPGATNLVRVEVSENGVAFTVVSEELQPTDAKELHIDLDAGGFGPDAEVRFLRLTVNQPSINCSQCVTICLDPSYDAIEVANNRNLVFDQDFDRVLDGLDNCRFTPNPTQTDSDTDEVGDVCDNCPADADFDQSDRDGDGFGDICDAGELVLADVTPMFSQPVWELRYRCPGFGLHTTVNTGIVPPAGVDPSKVFFGGPNATFSCEEPTGQVTIPNPPAGYTPGIGCANATEVAASLDLNASGVLGPGLTSPAGVREDTLYLTATFAGCTAREEVPIGRLHYEAPTGTPAPQLTSRGVATPGLGLDEADVRVAIIDPNVGLVELTLSPAPGETAGSETRWELCVEAQGEINRLSLGFEAPAGTSTSDMKWLGCDSAPAGAELRRTCSSFASQYAGRVAPSCQGSACPSYTEGPDSADPVPTLFVVLEGVEPSSEPPLLKLNTADQSTCVGQVELTASPGVPPDLTLSGLEALPNQPPLAAAVDSLPPLGVPDEVSTLDVGVVSASGGTSDDTDADSVRDEDDNCRYLANTSQTNTGGLLSSVGADNHGDDCECGDLDFDGRMLLGGPDLPILVDVLLGTETSPAVLNRCSVVDGPECDLRDAVHLQLGLDGKIPAFEQVCEDGVLPVP